MRFAFLLPLALPVAATAQTTTYTSGTGVPYDRVEDPLAFVLTSRTPETYHPGHAGPDGPAVTGIETLRLFPDCPVESDLMGPGRWLSLDQDIVVSFLEGDAISFDQPPPPEAGPACSLDAPPG